MRHDLDHKHDELHTADYACATCRDVDAAGQYRLPGYASHRMRTAMASGVDSYGGLLTYTGGWLDRAGGRRADAKWLDELLNRPDATLIPFWRDQCLVSGDRPVPVTLQVARADGVVFLGLDADGHGAFATDLSGMEAEQAAELGGASRAPLRRRPLATGAGYCTGTAASGFAAPAVPPPSRPGADTSSCGNDACGRLHFPKIEPAVIMTVQTERGPRRILLARHRGSSGRPALRVRN